MSRDADERRSRDQAGHRRAVDQASRAEPGTRRSSFWKRIRTMRASDRSQREGRHPRRARRTRRRASHGSLPASPSPRRHRRRRPRPLRSRRRVAEPREAAGPRRAERPRRPRRRKRCRCRCWLRSAVAIPARPHRSKQTRLPISEVSPTTHPPHAAARAAAPAAPPPPSVESNDGLRLGAGGGVRAGGSGAGLAGIGNSTPGRCTRGSRPRRCRLRWRVDRLAPNRGRRPRPRGPPRGLPQVLPDGHHPGPSMAGRMALDITVEERRRGAGRADPAAASPKARAHASFNA